MSPSPTDAMLFTKFAWTWPNGSGEEFFLDIVNVFLLFHIYLRLEKSVALHLNKLEFPTPKDALWQIWSKFAHAMVLKKKMKMWKVYRQTDRRTDGDRRRTTGDQESSFEQPIMGQVALSYSIHECPWVIWHHEIRNMVLFLKPAILSGYC